MKTPPTNRDLLISVSAMFGMKQRPQRLRQALSEDDRWASLIRGASCEGMTGLLYRGLQQTEHLNAIPPRYVNQLASIYYHTVADNLNLMADFEEILLESSRVGIEPIVLQGMALQGDVYPDPGVRPMSDIDLWVDRPDFHRFSKLLIRMGYQQDPLYSGSFARGSTKLDVHTHLFWADRLKSRKWLTRKNANTFTEKAEYYQLGNVTARRLCAVDQVLYLGMHALKHNVDRLIWLVDISRLLAGMSTQTADQLLTRAESFGLTPQMGYVGFLIQRLLSEKTVLMAGEKGVGPLASWVLRHRDRQNALPGWSPLVLFAAGKDVRLGLIMLWEMMFPEARVLRQVFADAPSAPSWRLYLYRLRQMIGMLK